MVEKRTFSISELSQEFDVTTRSIRFYEDQGLLKPRRRGQTRIFSTKDRVRLKLILRGKRMGFTLAETRELFDLWDETLTGNEKQLLKMLEILDDENLMYAWSMAAMVDGRRSSLHYLRRIWDSEGEFKKIRAKYRTLSSWKGMMRECLTKLVS